MRIQYSYFLNSLWVASLLALSSCSDDISPTDSSSKNQAYALLKSKIETTTYGRSVSTNSVTYEYDTSSVPVLKRELRGQIVGTYTYPSKETVAISYADKDTKKVSSKLKYTLNPTTQNVVKIEYDDGSVYTFEYDAAGYLTKNSFEPEFSFTYQNGNLVSKTSKTNNTTYNQTYTYTNIENKPYWYPFIFGKADKNLVDNITTTTTVEGKATTQSTVVNYAIDKNGYTLSEKQQLSNGAYIESKSVYQLYKR